MPPTGAGARILVIDDDPQVVEMVTELLTEQGHHVMSALSGPAGVELALQDSSSSPTCSCPAWTGPQPCGC